MHSIRAKRLTLAAALNRRAPFQGRALPILDDPRYECFSQLLSKGVPQGQAYVDAGFQATTDQSIRVGAHKLAKKTTIAKRVTELQEAAARRAERESGIDKKWVLLRLRDLSEAAQVANQYGPSVRAIELIGKEKSMLWTVTSLNPAHWTNLALTISKESLNALMPRQLDA